MTLEEAIKHAEEVADSHDKIKQIKAVTLEECRCAEEHRQLAEWLKDYKRLLEQEPCETCEHSDEINGSNCYECVKGIRDRYNPHPCGDAVSRQAVLSMQYSIDDSATLSTRDVVNVDDIEDLPPVNSQPCPDAISRQAVRDTIYAECSGTKLDIDFAKVLMLQRAIKDLPPVTPQPKTGHWIEQIDYEENCRTLICSNCDRPALHDEDSIWKHKFCPHCGAKMVEPQESEVQDADSD